MDSTSEGRAVDASNNSAAQFVEVIRRNYKDLLGHIPPSLENRFKLAQATGRSDAFAAVERMREELLHRNPLDRRTQQLVHFGMLVALRASDAARLHAVGAMKAGATLSDLQGVAETAAVVVGMPGFGLAIEIIAETALYADSVASFQSSTQHDDDQPIL